MSEYTPNLNLFKYNPTTDGKEVFSIEQALNHNWDILDGCGGPTTTVSGTTWVRTFSDGWKEQSGKLTTSASSRTWSRPALSNNTSYGTISSTLSSGSEYYLFTSSGYLDVPQGTSSIYVYWQFPNEVKFTNCNLTGGYTGGASSPVASVQISVLQNNSWTQVGTVSMSNADSAEHNVTLTAIQTSAIRLTLNHSYAYTQWPGRLKNVYFTGTEYITSLDNVTFPLAFTNTDYTATLGFEGGSGVKSYITQKTTTGMKLFAENQIQCYWMACGY